MSVDSWALIAATILGVVLTWIGSSVAAHFGGVKGGADSAASKADSLERELLLFKAEISRTVSDIEKDFLRFQATVAGEYVKTPAINRLETNIFAAIARIEDKIDNLQGHAK